jgi:hypothetical protein
MVRDLVTRAQGAFDYAVTITEATPSWLTGSNWSQLFPQLAVAIGDAMPVMPQQT